MKWNLLGALCAGSVSLAAHSATIGVIDSGYDYEHEALVGKLWTNPGEIPGDAIDNDGDGKIDDIYGWNFADNNAEIIDFSLQASYSPALEKFFEFQLAASKGTATEGELIWMKDQLKDSKFLKNLEIFGNYAHGTHVAGIIAKDNPAAKLIALKLISTKESFRSLHNKVQSSLAAGQDLDFIKEFVIKLGLWGIAYQQSQSFSKIAAYLSQQGVTVANGSFGVGMEQARSLVSTLLLLLTTEPSQELIDEYAGFFVQKIAEEQTKIFSKYPDILFVFAAGNDATNNDAEPIAPASIRLDNVMSIGASIGNTGLAPFSNYGASTVDLFAAGVGVLSSVPRGNLYLPLSGTSMAAPAVTRAAAMIKDRNPKLSPLEIREILKGTVDRKVFLKGKAYSEGVLNDERALFAAEETLTMPVKQAIQLAQKQMVDKAATSSLEGPVVDFSVVTPF